MAPVRTERQQVAVDRRTFVVTTHTDAYLPDGAAIAAELRAAALDAIGDLAEADARALGDALIAKAEPGKRPATAIAQALADRLTHVSAAARGAVDAGAVELAITGKAAVPRAGGRTRAQLLALIEIASAGLYFDDSAGFAVIPGAGPVKVAVARALATRGDIAPVVDEDPDSELLWRITEGGQIALTEGLEALAHGTA